MPRSAPDHEQIVDYTVRSHLIKNKTDRNHKANSSARDSSATPHNCVGLNISCHCLCTALTTIIVKNLAVYNAF